MNRQNRHETKTMYLWSHPQGIQWCFEMLVQSENGSWTHKIQKAFHVIIKTPIEIRVTKNKMGIFKDNVWPLPRSGYPVVTQCHRQLNNKQFFDDKVEKPEFLDVHYSNCIFDQMAEKNIDRVGCVAWLCWWIMHANPNKWFACKDICVVALQTLLGEPLTKHWMPAPPFKTPTPITTIRSIYKCVQDVQYDA